MEKNQRRNFLKEGAGALLGTALATSGITGCVSRSSEEKSELSTSSETYTWRLVSTWPPKFPVLGEGLDMLSKWVETASAGRMKIKVYGGGELVPPLECFDAVSQGAAQMASGVSYYWAGKIPASQFFAAIPFGMNAQQTNSWIINGGGLALWEELYEPYNLLPIPGGNTGVQMGGWFRKEIKSAEDLKGLKMRIPGLGGKAFSRAGGTAILSPGNELYTNLERGVIDATEWIGPYHDYVMGFYSVAKYYYYPGWHEPGPVLEIFVNKSQFEALPLDLQEIIRSAVYRMNIWTLGEFEAKNNLYLRKLVNEEGVQVKRFPEDVLQVLRKASKEVIQELVEKDEMSRRIYESYHEFRKNIQEWANISEKVFYETINSVVD